MRRRLLLSTLAAAVTGIVLLGLPLAVAVRGLLRQQALDALQREAEQVQVLLNEQAVSPAEQAALLQSLAVGRDLRLTLLDARGGRGVVIDTGSPPAVPQTLDADVRRALSGQVGRAWADGVLAVAVPVRAGGATQVLRAVRDDRVLAHQTKQALLAIAGLAVTALGVAASIAFWQAGRLAQPLESLAGAARRLGDGDFTARAPRSGLPEADDVAAALDVTAARLGAMLERSRSFGADASHQLRTPLTALRLDLEALEAAGADAQLVRAATVEADRLEATIGELLALAEPPAGDELLDLGELAATRIDAWQALARAQGRRVVVQAAPVPPVRARAAALGQCLQVLLDNALEHGAGTITVTVQAVSASSWRSLRDRHHRGHENRLGRASAIHVSAGAGRDLGWVRLCVADEGRGVAPEQATELLAGHSATAAGRGLPLARSLVEAEGGRLTLERPGGCPLFCLLVPAASGGNGHPEP